MSFTYKREHIDFIVNLRKQGKTYGEIAIAFARKFGLNKSSKALKSIFLDKKHEYDLKSLKSTAEIKEPIVKKKLIDAFIEIVNERKYIPILEEYCKSSKIDHKTVTRYFNNFEILIKEAKSEYPKVFENIIDETSFGVESYKDLKKYISHYDRFIITCAVTGVEPHANALKAVETYQKHNKAGLLILPCSDPAKQKEHKNKWSLSHKLPKESIVFAEVMLNNNLFISTIKQSAKQIKPLTGVKRLAHSKGSVIIASPKQFLEHIANSNNNQDIPRAVMTPGCITESDYETEMYMSERTAYLADLDHVLGALIVEVKNNKTFFVRQVQFEKKTGAFCDLNKKYYPDGNVEDITAELVQLGDYHVMSTDPQAKQMGKEIVELVQPDYMTVEDFLDGLSINPHEDKNKVRLSEKYRNNQFELSTELKANRKEIDDICKWPIKKKIIFKYGNHEDFLYRWICDAKFIDQPHNKILGMKLNIAVEELEVMPYEYAMRELFKIEQPDKVQFLGLDESFKINGVENGAHGHLGKGGRRNPTLEELEECYGACNVGHNHSASIFRSVFRVGTTSYKNLSYNHGASSWTHTHLIQHRNGSRQLITSIFGEWRLP
jgi:hypothetical protein